MIKRTIILTIALTCVWIVFTERFTLMNIIIGVILSIFISCLTNAALPKSKSNVKKQSRIKFHKMITYPFWLIRKLYMDSFSLIKIIFTGAKCGVVKEQIELDNEVLQAILAYSIALPPGAMFLEQNGKEVTFLCLENEKNAGYPEAVCGLRKIEKRLQKAEAKEKHD